MKKIIFFLALIYQCSLSAQVIAWGPGTFTWTRTAPVHNPGQNGAKFAVDTTTFQWYEWVNGTSWQPSGQRLEEISGTTSPNYTPGKHDSYLVINFADSLYRWRSGAWRHINKSGGGASTLTESYIGYGSALNTVTGDTALVWISDSLRMGINWTNPTAELTLKGAPNAVTTATITDFQASVFAPETYTLGGDWIANDVDRQFDNATGSGTLTFLIGALSDDFLYDFSVNVTNYTDKITLSIGGTDYEITSAGTFTLSGVDLTGVTEIYFTAAGGPTTIKAVAITHVIPAVSSYSVMDVINPGTGLPYPQFGLVVTNSSLSLSGTLKNNSGTDNIAIGSNALKLNNIGNFSTAIGANALSVNTSSNNTAIGSGALKLNASGTNNLAIGSTSLEAGTSNSNNTAVGVSAGRNATGSSNIFIGTSAGANASAGTGNIYIGSLTGVNNSGSNNTALGSGSGNSGSASRCIYLGTSAGAGNNVSDRLYIEPTNSTTPLISGNFSTDMVGINKNITTLSATLDVGGTVKVSGALIPGRWTTATRPIPAANTNPIGFNTDLNKHEGWDGTVWQPFY